MTHTEFVYTTYIKTTPEKVWNAITNPEFSRQYFGSELVSDWKKGSKWQSISNDKDACKMVVGEIIESLPPKRLVMTWHHPEDEMDKSEHSRVTFEIETIEDMVRLNVIHDRLKAGSDMARGIAVGWPLVLSCLKSLLETGKALNVRALKDHVRTNPAVKKAAAQ